MLLLGLGDADEPVGLQAVDGIAEISSGSENIIPGGLERPRGGFASEARSREQYVGFFNPLDHRKIGLRCSDAGVPVQAVAWRESFTFHLDATIRKFEWICQSAPDRSLPSIGKTDKGALPGLEELAAIRN
jgi:hypothetical protein